MLVVRVEIWPGGDASGAQELSRIGIVNVSGLKENSNYEVIALLNRHVMDEVVQTEVRDHRRSTGWLPLVRRTLVNLHLRDSVCREGSYDDVTAQLLRRGDHVKRT